ncbi:MAG: FAD:protein FMN transferase [Bacteroidales bacterium]|nr:FAD:protein FMN transferase [Bacteroidales bacterium]
MAMQTTTYNRRPIKRCCPLFLLLVFFLASCGKTGSLDEKPYMVIQGFTQGTTYMVKYSSQDSTDYKSEIRQILYEVDSSMSTYKDNSIISRINRNEGLVRIDHHFRKVFQTAQRVSRMTGGAFDITVAPLVNAWGFGFTEGTELDRSKIDSILDFVGYRGVRLKEGQIIKDDQRVMIDMNAIAQGYAVDAICGFLDKQAIPDYLVEIGGEVRTKGLNPDGEPWRIGIDKPIDSSSARQRELQAIASIGERAVATSGSYRKFYVEDGVKYSHTINPQTGYPVQHSLLSATVFAEECVFADALATAFMVMGREKSKQILKEHPSLGAYFIYSDDQGNFQIDYTENVKDLIRNL